MDLSYQKKLAASILKCSPKRIRIEQDKEVEKALTRNDIKDLIRNGLIRKIPKRGPNKSYAREKARQKAKGRKKGFGRRKGKAKWTKRDWIKTIRPLRKMLKEFKKKGIISVPDYKKLYLKAKGGAFRNKKHMLFYMKERGMLKEYEKR